MAENAEIALAKMEEYVKSHPDEFSYFGMYQYSEKSRQNHIVNNLKIGRPSELQDKKTARDETIGSQWEGLHWIEIKEEEKNFINAASD